MTYYLFYKKVEQKITHGGIKFNLFLLSKFFSIVSLSICLSLCFSNKEGHTGTKKNNNKENTLAKILKHSTAVWGIQDLTYCLSSQKYSEIYKGILKNCKKFPRDWVHLKKKMYAEACKCGFFWIWKKKKSLPYYIISACSNLQVYNASHEKIFSFYPNVVAHPNSYFPMVRRTAFFPMKGKQSILVFGVSKSYARGTIWELILVAFRRKKFYLLAKEFSHRSGTYPMWWFEDGNNDGIWELCISYDTKKSKKCARWDEKIKKWHVEYREEKPSSKRHEFPYCGYR